MNSLLPIWIIGGPFVGMLILAFAFKGPSAMGGLSSSTAPRGRSLPNDASAPLLDPMHPGAPRRNI